MPNPQPGELGGHSLSAFYPSISSALAGPTSSKTPADIHVAVGVIETCELPSHDRQTCFYLEFYTIK